MRMSNKERVISYLLCYSNEKGEKVDGRTRNQLGGSLTQLARHLGDFTLRQMVKTEGSCGEVGGAEKKYRVQTTAQWSRCQLGCSCSQNFPCKLGSCYRSILSEIRV